MSIIIHMLLPLLPVDVTQASQHDTYKYFRLYILWLFYIVDTVLRHSLRKARLTNIRPGPLFCKFQKNIWYPSCTESIFSQIRWAQIVPILPFNGNSMERKEMIEIMKLTRSQLPSTSSMIKPLLKSCMRQASVFPPLYWRLATSNMRVLFLPII